MELSLARASELPASICSPVSSAEAGKTLPHNRSDIWIAGAALLALVIKLTIAFNTIGTNDVLLFSGFARNLSEHGLEWTYRHSMYFNHPPLIAWFLRASCFVADQLWVRNHWLVFPFLLRLPGIVADFVSVLLLLRLSAVTPKLHLPRWSLVLFALSPVSIMVSGFHGNTDPLMVMFLLLASLMAAEHRPLLCGISLAIACQIKIIPLLLTPVFFFFWTHRQRAIAFLAGFALTSILLWWEPLFKFPLLLVRNVLAYGSYWGIWGITYWLRLTGFKPFAVIDFVNLSFAQNIIVSLLKAIIILGVLLIAWRRRAGDGLGLIKSLAYAWLVFFIFSPGVSAQYMIWLAPFILILSPPFYGWLTAASTVFLFFFYNTTGPGFPWYLTISTNYLSGRWTPWTIWPWGVLVIGMVLLWRKRLAIDGTQGACATLLFSPVNRASND